MTPELLKSYCCLCPHPPAQFLQSQPHCRDFPLFLSITIFLITNPTIQIKIPAVINVPITASLPVCPNTLLHPMQKLFSAYRLFHIYLQRLAFPAGSEKKIQETSYQKDCHYRSDAKCTCAKQHTQLIYAEGNHIS